MQSKETERLLGKYARLQDENAQLRRDREVLTQCGRQASSVVALTSHTRLQLVEETQRELVKRTHFYQRLIKKLHERIQVTVRCGCCGTGPCLSPTLSLSHPTRHLIPPHLQEEGLRRPKSPIVTLDDEAEESRALISDLHRQVDELHGELKEAHVEADIARSEARHATTEYKRVVALQDETVHLHGGGNHVCTCRHSHRFIPTLHCKQVAFLMQSVADVKQQVASAAHSG